VVDAALLNDVKVQEGGGAEPFLDGDVLDDADNLREGSAAIVREVVDVTRGAARVVEHHAATVVNTTLHAARAADNLIVRTLSSWKAA
jgi:hypothetical protein